jgi:hypothetical protein
LRRPEGGYTNGPLRPATQLRGVGGSMFVRGERVDTLRRPRAAPTAARRPRYCLRCGGPLGLSPGAPTGIRCLACGAQPAHGTRVRVEGPARDFIMPRRDARSASAAGPAGSASSTGARPRSPVVTAGLPATVHLDVLRTWMPRWSMPRWSMPRWSMPRWSMPRWSVPRWSVPRWRIEVSRPSARTMITAAAAAVAILTAFVVTMTLS